MAPALVSCSVEDVRWCVRILIHDGAYLFCEAAAFTRSILLPAKNVNDPSSPRYQSV